VPLLRARRCCRMRKRCEVGKRTTDLESPRVLQDAFRYGRMPAWASRAGHSENCRMCNTQRGMLSTR
jgi:hypothetical protein